MQSIPDREPRRHPARYLLRLERERLAAVDLEFYRRFVRPIEARIAAEVPAVTVGRFAANHGIALPEWVNAEARAVAVRFGAIGWRRRGYAGFYEQVGRGRGARLHRRPHIVLGVSLRCEPREVRAETFLHELAHIIVGPGEQHGARWRALAAKLGIANPSRRCGTLAIPLGPGDASLYDRAHLRELGVIVVGAV